MISEPAVLSLSYSENTADWFMRCFTLSPDRQNMITRTLAVTSVIYILRTELSFRQLFRAIDCSSYFGRNFPSRIDHFSGLPRKFKAQSSRFCNPCRLGLFLVVNDKREAKPTETLPVICTVDGIAAGLTLHLRVWNRRWGILVGEGKRGLGSRYLWDWEWGRMCSQSRCMS